MSAAKSATVKLLRRDSAVETFQLVAEWRSFLADALHRSERTIRQYSHYLLDLQGYLVPKPLPEATEQDLLAYLGRLGPQGAAKGSATPAMRSFYGWLHEGGYATENAARRLRVKPPKEKPIEPLDRDEETRLLIAAAWREPRRAWALLLLANTGLRRASIAALRPEDAKNGWLTVRVAKNDRPYVMPLNAHAQVAVDELTAIARERGYDTLLGVKPATLALWVQEASAETGVRAWPHKYRHTFASRLAEADVDGFTIGELMNHRDLGQVLRRYVHVRGKRKSEAVDRLE